MQTLVAALAPALAGLVLASLPACREPVEASADAGLGGDDAGGDYPEPRHDLVPSVGSDSTFELATWNIENFPKTGSTPAVVADLITSLDIDMLAMEEVQDIDAFNELVARLRGYTGVLSSHTYGDGTYQKVGYIYRTSLVSTSGTFLLFTANGFEFPRPVLKVDVTVGSGASAFSYTSLALHLKAGSGGQDAQRREEAVVILEDYLRTAVDGNGLDTVVALGDFNATLDNGASVFAPLTAASDRYDIHTSGNFSAGDISFVPSSVLLDHIVTTTAFDDAHPGSTTVIPRLDMQMTGYVSQVSDHLPVIMRMPL